MEGNHKEIMAIENLPDSAPIEKQETDDPRSADVDFPTPFGTKLKPISAFSASECSSTADLAKICFTASPVPSMVVHSSSSYSSTVSCTGTDINSVSDHGGDVGPLGLVNFASNSGRDMLLLENSNDSSASGAIENVSALPVQLQSEHPSTSNSIVESTGRWISDIGSTTATAVNAAENSSATKNVDSSSFKSSLPADSRIGRDNQRFETCSKTGHLIRLVAGTVPITNDGSILFVSAAKKREWILPKGGWELDETIEESALRETYEEAGVFGTLGPRLCDVVYETRKGRKRRLEEMCLKTSEKEITKISRPQAIDNTPVLDGQEFMDETGTSHRKFNSIIGISSVASTTSGNSSEDDEPLSLCRLFSSSAPNHQQEGTTLLSSFSDVCADLEPNEVVDGNKTFASEGTASAPASICRMALFPLYISEVLEDWPESGRSRKVFPLDEAIQMSQRAEIRLVLEEIKRRGLNRPTLQS